MVTIISLVLTVIIIKKWLKYYEKHNIHPTEEETKKNEEYLLLWGD